MTDWSPGAMVHDGDAGAGAAPPAGPKDLPAEALRIWEIARGQGISLALAGSAAVQLVCPVWKEVLPGLGRRPVHDIDFWALGSDEARLEKLFSDLGYATDESIAHMREWGIQRLIFEHREDGLKVDVFLDKLVMAHTIPFQSRLRGVDQPLVPFTDLLLSKLQIHELTRNDLLDLFVLLGEWSSAQATGAGSSATTIDEEYLQRVLGSDWGFWYDARENLLHLREAISELTTASDEQRQQVSAAAGQWIEFLDTCKKSSSWKRRGWIGTKSRWYELVREVTD